MTTDNDNNRNNEHDNDNGGRGAVTPAPTSKGELANTAALAMVLNGIDLAPVAGWSGLPMLTFKRDGNGTWMFGQKKTVVEDGSKWAINPKSFKWGYICFNNDNKPTERIVPVSQPKPDVTELPDTGFEWHEQWAVNLKCLTGTDRGVEVTYKAATVGGVQAIAGVIAVVRDRLNAGQHDGSISPVALLEKSSYPHPQFGKIWTPVLTIVDWMPLDGPASPPPPPTPPASTSADEQPRRRRVVG